MIRTLQQEAEKLHTASSEATKSSNRVAELEEEVRRLRGDLEQEKAEKQDMVSEKELLKKKHDEVSG